MSKALVFLAEGFEEIEASTIIDILRRSGVEVIVFGLESGLIEGSHGIKFMPEKSIEEANVKDFDAVICPGGSPGYRNLRNNQRVIDIVKEAFETGRLVAAICASPAVLSDAGILKDKECTIYPGMEKEIEKGGGKFVEDVVVVDGNIITSRGPATALPFALKLVEKLAGKKTADNIRENTLANLAS